MDKGHGKIRLKKKTNEPEDLCSQAMEGTNDVELLEIIKT